MRECSPCGSEETQLSSRDIQANGVSIYKCIPSTDTFLSYNNSGGVPPKYSPLSQSEWRALYTQFQAQHVLGTLPYRWENGAALAKIVRVTFDNLNIVVLDGKKLHDSSVSGSEKALQLKRLLSINPSLSLMQTLGEQGRVALVRETESEWELVIPHQLLSHLTYTEHVVATFKKHSIMPVTLKWREGEEGAWNEWEEGLATDCIPNLTMDWFH